MMQEMLLMMAARSRELTVQRMLIAQEPLASAVGDKPTAEQLNLA